jgi:hypothetical protein
MLIFLALFLQGGSWYWTMFAIIYVGTQLIELLAAWWLRQWTAATDQKHSVRSLDFYLVVYASILTLGVVSSALRWIVLYDGVTTRASSMIHRSKFCSSAQPEIFFCR